MKSKFTFSFIFFIISFVATAQRPFITTWNTGNAGITKSNQIFLNATGSNFNVSWINTANSADTNHATINGNDTITFATQGIYKVYITPGSGSFSAIKLFSYNVGSRYGDNRKLLSIEQWGDIEWSTFDSAFMFCESMVLNATDVPKLTNVSDMSAAFLFCFSLTTNAAMANWDVSNVTNMKGMFSYDAVFNQPIGNWNVSKVTNMNNMFSSAYIFNQPLNSWNVSKVTDMTQMFFLAYQFNQPINNWNVSNVTSMNAMFHYDTAFNQPLNNWNVSNVTSMQAMFDDATHFNQAIGNWNVEKVTDMSFMFERGIYFNQPVGNWNVSSVTNMNSMFLEAYAFNQPLNSWDVSNVTNMSTLFAETNLFNQPLANWNVSNVTDMSDMFAYTKVFNQPIGNWNVSKVTNMGTMFQQAALFNQPIGNWNVNNVTNMIAMFLGAGSFNQPIGNWIVSNVTDMSYMFDGNNIFNKPIGNWNVSNVTDMSYMFNNNSAFNQSIGNWNVSKVTNMASMFSSATLFNQPIGKWNVSNVKSLFSYTGMGSMFLNAKAFNQNIGSWNLSGAPGMQNMLDSSGMSCSNYSLTLKGWADSTYTPNNLLIGAARLTYDSAIAKTAHDSLTDIKGWTITGDKIGNCSTMLPVNFISFNAIQQGNTAVLNWHVADEINDKGYDVEKSVNGFNYNSIGFVAAKANKQTSYIYTDNNITDGTNYYRIKEIDNDGKYIYSTVQKIEYSKFTWKINGNPVNNSSVELMLDNSANISIQIVSSNGGIIKTIQKGRLITGNYNIPLNINNVSAGVYIVRLVVDDKIYTAVIVK